jgi:hypothetical protein
MKTMLFVILAVIVTKCNADLLTFEPACQIEIWDREMVIKGPIKKVIDSCLNDDITKNGNPSKRVVGKLNLCINHENNKTSVFVLMFDALELNLDSNYNVSNDKTYEIYSERIIDMTNSSNYKITTKNWSSESKELYLEDKSEESSIEIWINVSKKINANEKIDNVWRNAKAYNFEILIKSITKAKLWSICRIRNVTSDWAKEVVKLNPRIVFEKNSWNPK